MKLVGFAAARTPTTWSVVFCAGNRATCRYSVGISDLLLPLYIRILAVENDRRLVRVKLFEYYIVVREETHQQRRQAPQEQGKKIG